MWTEPLSNGKFKVVERYKDPITGKQKKISVVIDSDTRKARKEAQRILDEKIEAILGKSDYDSMTLQELGNRYADSHSKPSTRKNSEVEVRRLCRLLDPDARVNSLTANYVLDRLPKEEKSFNVCVTYFKAIMNFGFENDFVKDVSWMKKIKKKKSERKIRIEDKYLEPDELQRLIDEIDIERWKLLTKFLALSGLRIGEALALTMDDLDTHIHVTKTYMVVVGGVGDVPKTVDSNREVFIQPELAEVITDIKKWRLAEQFASGDRSNVLFPGSLYHSYQDYLRKNSKNIIGRRISPHTLRHTHASLLAAEGMSLEAISRRLGHSDSKITKEVYLHVTEKLRQREEEQMSKIRIL